MAELIHVEKIKDALKEAYNIIMMIVLSMAFLYFEVRNIETINWLVMVMIITSIMIAIIVPFLIHEFSPYAGLTFYVFGLLIIIIDGYRYLQIRRFNTVLIGELTIGVLLIIDAFILRDRNWSLLHFKQKIKYQDNAKRKKINYVNASSEFYKRMR